MRSSRCSASDEGGDITSGAGYLDAELLSLMLPLLVIVLAIGSGARTYAGEEEGGRLELVFSYPLRRRNAVLAKEPHWLRRS